MNTHWTTANESPSKRERIATHILCSLINSERYLEHLIIQGRQNLIDMDSMIDIAITMTDKMIDKLEKTNNESKIENTKNSCPF